MSTAADLILATPDDVQAIVESDYPLGKFKGVSADGLDPLKLAALHWALVQRTLKDLLPDYHPVAEASPQGPWLVRVPDELIAALSKISPTDQPGVVAKWASTRQAQEAGWSEQDAEDYLGRLLPFARTAAFERKALFLFVYD
jgi:hypothetical protein